MPYCPHPWHFSTWGLDKAASSLCAARLCRLVLAEVVRDEVEENLLLHAERVTSLETDELIAHYRRLVELTDPDAAGIRQFWRRLWEDLRVKDQAGGEVRKNRTLGFDCRPSYEADRQSFLKVRWCV